MTYYRYFFLLLSVVVFVPTLLTGQQEKVQSMKLNIIHQKKGAKKDTIELHDQAAVDFNIADFLAKNSRSRIHLNGSFIGDHEFVHFGYDSSLYPEKDKACEQFCSVVKSVRHAPLFGVVTVSTDDFEGEEITRIIEGSAADQAGLLPGDVILYINDIEIRSSCDLIKVISNNTAIGDTIVVEINRDGVYQVIEVIMGFKIKKIVMWQPCCDGDAPDEVLLRDLQVYPNPASDIAQFQFTSTDEQAIRFFLSDVTGRILLEERVENFKGLHQGHLDLTRFASGMYFFTVIQGKSTMTERLALQKL